MEQIISDILQACSKDEKSYSTLYSLFSRLTKKAGSDARRLDLLERTVQNDYDTILITDLKLEQPGPSIVYVNKAFTELTGYSRDEVSGETMRLLNGQKTDQDLFEQMNQRLREGQSFIGTFVNYRKDGSEFLNQWDMHPLYDEYGIITNWVAYLHDVSERESLEQRWKELEVESRPVIERNSDNIRLLFDNRILQSR